MDQSTINLRPKCYTPHTRYCELFAIFDTVITKFSKIKHIDSDIFNTLINYDIKATNMYSLIYNKSLLKGPMDYITSPKYIK